MSAQAQEPSPPSRDLPAPSRLDPRRALVRTTLAAVVGCTAGLLLSARYSTAVSVLGGWDAGGLVLLALAWAIIVNADAPETERRAATADFGRTAVYVLVLLTSAASLFAATPLLRSAKGAAPRDAHELVALCLATVALSWTLTHTAFTLRYAHLYYREDEEGVGGVEFPGGARPSYLDFAYVAFTVGMCFQVSDVAVSSAQIRRTVLLHAALSFLYNTAILAFVLNLAFGMAS